MFYYISQTEQGETRGELFTAAYLLKRSLYLFLEIPNDWKVLFCNILANDNTTQIKPSLQVVLGSIPFVLYHSQVSMCFVSRIPASFLLFWSFLFFPHQILTNSYCRMIRQYFTLKVGLTPVINVCIVFCFK